MFESRSVVALVSLLALGLMLGLAHSAQPPSPNPEIVIRLNVVQASPPSTPVRFEVGVVPPRLQPANAVYVPPETIATTPGEPPRPEGFRVEFQPVAYDADLPAPVVERIVLYVTDNREIVATPGQPPVQLTTIGGQATWVQPVECWGVAATDVTMSDGRPAKVWRATMPAWWNWAAFQGRSAGGVFVTINNSRAGVDFPLWNPL